MSQNKISSESAVSPRLASLLLKTLSVAIYAYRLAVIYQPYKAEFTCLLQAKAPEGDARAQTILRRAKVSWEARAEEDIRLDEPSIISVPRLNGLERFVWSTRTLKQLCSQLGIDDFGTLDSDHPDMLWQLYDRFYKQTKIPSVESGCFGAA
jgi:hypothetical protein